MSTLGTAESDWEQFALEILGELGWEHMPGQAIGPGSGERDGWDDLVLRATLLAALRRLNPDVPGVYLQEALRRSSRRGPTPHSRRTSASTIGWSGATAESSTSTTTASRRHRPSGC